jgi:hypothetical protein
MTAKGIVRAIQKNAPWNNVLCLALWVEPTDKGSDASEDVATRLLAVVAIEQKAIRKHVAPARSWGWVVTLPVTKKIGVALFVPKSKQAYKSVRLLHVSSWQKHSLMPRKRWVTFDRSSW